TGPSWSTSTSSPTTTSPPRPTSRSSSLANPSSWWRSRLLPGAIKSSRRTIMRTASIIMATILFAGAAGAAEIDVLSTQATQEAYIELVAQFEKATGHKVKTEFTGTLNVQKRLAAGESFDMIIMAAPAIDEQIKLGKAVAGMLVDLAKSGTGVAVRKGAPKPDIGSVEAFRKTLLSVKSIGYSTGPSGVYML